MMLCLKCGILGEKTIQCDFILFNQFWHTAEQKYVYYIYRKCNINEKKLISFFNDFIYVYYQNNQIMIKVYKEMYWISFFEMLFIIHNKMRRKFYSK